MQATKKNQEEENTLEPFEERIFELFCEICKDNDNYHPEWILVERSNYSSAVVRNTLMRLEKLNQVIKKPRSSSYPGDNVWKLK